jgi:hypothetical protein
MFHQQNSRKQQSKILFQSRTRLLLDKLIAEGYLEKFCICSSFGIFCSSSICICFQLNVAEQTRTGICFFLITKRQFLLLKSHHRRLRILSNAQTSLEHFLEGKFSPEAILNCLLVCMSFTTVC